MTLIGNIAADFEALQPADPVPTRILGLDDDESVRRLLGRILKGAGFEALMARHAPEALHILEHTRVDVLISDYQLPGIDGLELLGMLGKQADAPPVIMITGHGSVEHALAAIRAGAFDYVQKPFEPSELLHRVHRALQAVRMRRELEVLRREVSANRLDHRMIGASRGIQQVLSVVSAAAASRATVLIQGESGTGKELVARAIHEQGARPGEPFIQINCAALPEGLVESVLFGHEKGAFTGAIRRVEGAFERADRGTLLLDEISEMRLDLQAKLLRVIQERQFERVGGTEPVSVDVRIIATTNRDLAEEAEAGRFRRDLFYRLNVIPVHVPPLRERREDVQMLAYYFATRAAAEAGKRIDAVTPQAMDLLLRYSWPGNVRELQHAMERAVILARTPVLDAASFEGLRNALADERIVAPPPSPWPDSPEASSEICLPSLDLAQAEQALIRQALHATNGNRTHAAALLGVGVRTLRKKLARERGEG